MFHHLDIHYANILPVSNIDQVYVWILVTEYVFIPAFLIVLK